MITVRQFSALLCTLVAPLVGFGAPPSAAGAEPNSAKNGGKSEPVDVRALLEKGQASGALPEGMVIRFGACLGGPDEKAAGKGAPNELRESWEFTANQVRRIAPGEEDAASRAESRPFNSKELCKLLLDGKAIEIQARKGEGPEIGFVGSGYDAGSRFIEVVWKCDVVLRLGETNGPLLRLYRESDARAFGALYGKLASHARAAFKRKAAPSKLQGSAWGDAVKGLQMGVSPQIGTKGVPVALFDGKTLRIDVHIRNAGSTPVRIIPNTFGCAAVGPGGAIPVTKLILTPSNGGHPFSITYQGHNHVSEKRTLDAGDVRYFATVLAPGEAMNCPVTYTPGDDRTSSWQRAGGPNLVPDGKYQLKAGIVVDRKESEWKGELTSGSLEVEIRSSEKK